MKQKFLLFLVLLTAAFSVQAYDFEVDGIYYNYNYDDWTSVSVTRSSEYGEGSMYSSYMGDIIIPETVSFYDQTYTVTAIEDYAFYYSNINTISIPETVTYIGVNAFASSNLTSIFIPKSVTFIDSWAFVGCSMIESMAVASENHFYDSRDNCNAIIEKSGDKLIAGCYNTVIPNSVKEIGECAFDSQWQLTSITIPNSVTKIGGSAFANSGIQSLDIPNSVISIDDHAFSYCSSLKNIVFSNTLASIPNNVCQSCSQLTSVTLPNSVITIGSEAFYHCSALSEVTIPNSVTTIGNRAFSHCKGLTNIVIPNSVKTIGEWAFCACSKLASVIIPNSVITLKRYAFDMCTALTSVTIPSSVTLIGESVFGECTGLTSIIVESGNTIYDSRDNCNAIIETATNKLLQGCQATIIPNTINKIREYAFFNCKGLTTIDIPNSIIEIGNSAFFGCNNLNTVYCYISDLAQVTVGSTPFYRSPGGSTDRTLYIPRGTLTDYQADNKWSQYFDFIVEMGIEPGDIDGDGVLNVKDVSDLIDLILAGTASIEDYPAADVNGDGNINVADMTSLIDMLLSSN